MCKGNVFGYRRYLVHPHMYYLFSFLKILSILTYTKRGENVLKKLTIVCIQKNLILGYTVQALNRFNSHAYVLSLSFFFFFFVGKKEISLRTKQLQHG